jgi:2,5-dihydroxypyridine 5,6-dioxygenase
MIASAVRSTEINPAKLAFLFKKQFEMCKVKPGETVACVSDLATRREYIEAAFAAAESLGGDVYEMCVNSIPSWTKVGVPTIGKCKGTLEAMKAADIVVIFHVPLFTKWLKEVMDTGTRVLMIIDAPDDLEQLMAPRGLKDALKYAEERYRKTHEVRVISEAGTDFTYSCGEYPVMVQWAMPTSPAISMIGAPGIFTPSRMKGRPRAWSSLRQATSSYCRTAATCRIRSGWRSRTASSPSSKAASTPS